MFEWQLHGCIHIKTHQSEHLDFYILLYVNYASVEKNGNMFIFKVMSSVEVLLNI